MFEFGLNFGVLLLELSYLIVLDLDLLDGLVVLGVGLGCLDTILLLLTLKLCDHLAQLLILSLIPQDLVLNLLELVEEVDNLLIHFMFVILGILQRLGVLGTLLQAMVDVVLEGVTLCAQDGQLSLLLLQFGL